MPRVVFWNVERLGEGTDPRVGGMVGWVIGYLMENADVSDAYLCEVTSDFEIVVGVNNTTTKQVPKHGYRQRRSARRTMAQLGYAHIRDGDEVPVVPTQVQLRAHSEIFGVLPGGFAHNVAPIRHMVRHDRDIYVLHANSGKGGGAPLQIIRAWVQIYYATVGAQPVLFGDMNCEPRVLIEERDRYITYLESEFAKGSKLLVGGNALKQWNIAAAIEALKDMDIVDGGETFKVSNTYFQGKDVLKKTYDYAVTSRNNEVHVEAFDYRGIAEYQAEFTTKVMGGYTVGGTGCPSDHLPIVVSWGDV